MTNKEIGSVRFEGVVFFERAFVEQHFQPLARGELALGMLHIDALLPTAEVGLRPPLSEFGDNTAACVSRRGGHGG